MLLPLLGACAVVGPFWGPEWEPVWGLLSRDCSCRDPRCCGNLLILCLFLIWQVRHFRYQLTRIRSSKKNVSKVPLWNWVVPSQRGAASFGQTAEFFSPSHLRDLDAHIQPRVQNLRWRYQRSLQETWAQCLFCPQNPFRGSPWSVSIPSEPIFGTSSLLNTSLLPQNSSWEAWHVPWSHKDDQPHLALHTCQRIEQLLVHSHEMLVPLEHAVSRRASPTSTALVISLPDLPLAQRPQGYSGVSLPSNRPLGMLTRKAWESPQETWTPCSDAQTECSGEIQAPGWGNQREGTEEDAWEIQAPKDQLPRDSGMEDSAEAKALGCGKQRPVIRETDGEILAPEWEKQMGAENRTQIAELGKKPQSEAGCQRPPETQAHIRGNQEQLKCKTDEETQTLEWGSQDKNGGEDAVQTQTQDGKNQKEAREEEEREIQAQGLEKQGHPSGENGEGALSPEQGKQNQRRGDTGAETEAEEGRDEGQVGGGEAGQTQTSGGENLEEVEQQDGAEPQAREVEKVTEIQTPVGEEQDQGGSEKAKNTEAHGRENRKLSHVGWENQGLGRGKGAGEPRLSRKKQFREVREEHWVVIKAPWWGNQRLVVSELNRDSKMPCWGDQNQVGDENREGIQATEQSEQRKGRDEDGTNTWGPEAENKSQLRGESDMETHLAGRKNKEWLGGGNGTDIGVPGRRNLRRAQGEDGAEIQEATKESQAQLGNEFHGQIYIPKWKNLGHFRGKNSANIQTSETENWGELTSETDGRTQSAGWKKEEQDRGENGEEIQVPGMRSLRETGGEADTETGAAGEGSQSQAGQDVERKSHLSEWDCQEQRRNEGGTEIQVPEKRNQRFPGGEDRVKTQRPERENWGQLESGLGGCCSLGRGSWEQTGGENMAENQASKKRNWKKAGSEGYRKIQRFTSKKPRLLKSKVNGKSCSTKWKNQEQIGGGNGIEIQIRGKRNLGGMTDDDGTETQTPTNSGQGQLRREIDGEAQTQRPRNQNKGDEDTAETGGEGNRRKCRPEATTTSQAPRSRDEGQASRKDAARVRLQGDCCADEGPTGRKRSPARPIPLFGLGCGALDQEQEAAVSGGTLAPCSEKEPPLSWGRGVLLVGGEGQNPARRGAAPASEHTAAITLASQRAQPGSQRRRQRDRRVDPAKASSLTWQPENPQSLTALSACLSLPCGQVHQAARALADGSTVSPKWPVLKKSRRLLLESLMRRRIAHLKWGLPRRILESYLVFSFLGPCSMPLAGVRLPGLCTGQELQREQEKHCEAQGSTPGLKSPRKPQRGPPPERKSSKLPSQARTLEKRRPHWPAPMGLSSPPWKPRRTGPPGGARDRQSQHAVHTAALPAPGNPGPAEPSSWCGQVSVRESSSGNGRGGTVIRPGVSKMAERAPRRTRTSPSRAGHNHGKACTSWGASEPRRLKSRQSTCWAGGSPESVQGGGPGQQPASGATDASSLKRSMYSAAARLSVSLLSKRSWRSQLAAPRSSGPGLSLRGPRAGEDGVALGPALQPPGPCWAAAALPGTEARQARGPPGHPAAAPHRFHFMKHLPWFFLQRDVKK